MKMKVNMTIRFLANINLFSLGHGHHHASGRGGHHHGGGGGKHGASGGPGGVSI